MAGDANTAEANKEKGAKKSFHKEENIIRKVQVGYRLCTSNAADVSNCFERKDKHHNYFKRKYLCQEKTEPTTEWQRLEAEIKTLSIHYEKAKFYMLKCEL